MRFKIFLVVFVMLYWNTIWANPVDSVFQNIKYLPIPQQFEAIDQFRFDFVTQNSKLLIPYLHEYEHLARQKHQPHYLAKIFINLSLAYYYQGKYDENLNYGLKAIHLYDSLGDQSKLGTMYGELGYQMKRRDLPHAFELMQKGIAVLEKLGDTEPLAKIYDNYGVLHEMNNQFDSALYFYHKALSIKENRKDSLGIPYSQNNISSLYMLLEMKDSAIFYLNLSTKIRSERNDLIGLAENYSFLGQFYNSLNNYNEAFAWNQKALAIAQQHQYTYLIQSLYQQLSANCESMGKYQQALGYHKLYKQFQDSLLNLETNKTIANLQIQYETAEKEKELLKKDQEIRHERMVKGTIIISSLIVFLLMSAFFFYRTQLSRRNEKINVRNALIEGEQTERNRLAMELHDGIANDLNSVILNLDKPDEDKTSLKKGIGQLRQTHQSVRQLSHSLMPRCLEKKGLEAALNELKLNFVSPGLSIELQMIGFEQRPSAFIEFIVYRIVQEALNNIIKHARASRVLIDCNRVDNKLLVTIEDNGIGFNTGEMEGKGIGLQNMQNRVKMMDGKLHVRSVKGQGTTIEIEMPLNL